jgi:hypothetical protein
VFVLVSPLFAVTVANADIALVEVIVEIKNDRLIWFALLGPWFVTSAKLLLVESPSTESTRVHSGVDRLDADGTRVSGQESTNHDTPPP